MRACKIYVSFLLGVTATTILFLSLGSNFKQENEVARNSKNRSPSEIRTLDQLLALNPAEINSVDIGLMNLLCATGLKGSEDLNIDECLAKLDYWADYAKKDLSQRIGSFYRNPAKYDNSESLFKMVNLVLNLKLDMGIHYNLENMTHTDYTNSREIFIHGLLTGKHGGSCTSLPVLCAAIARRLGYPVKLAATS